jgi:hypothetical protein
MSEMKDIVEMSKNRLITQILIRNAKLEALENEIVSLNRQLATAWRLIDHYTDQIDELKGEVCGDE